MSTRIRLFDDFLSLFYPNLCLACDQRIPPKEDVICIPCQYQLPKTKFHLERENTFTEHFWGRIPIDAGAALYHFTKGGRTQQVIHKLKYEGKIQVGIKLGQRYGRFLKESPFFQAVEIIVPVPLHAQRQKVRGYNQSALFAQGLSKSMEIPWSKDALIRTSMTSSQTKKSRMERFENVSTAFQVKKPKAIEGKHILLVDDVMTTGATLEACANQLLSVPSTKISLATIAFANM